MPLNATQKEIIDSVIQFYFDDLSSDAKQLDEQIKSLRSAFENSIDEKDEKNDLFQLQKCLFCPEINLRRLEDSNPDITFKDVQEYILEYATDKLQIAAEKAHLELDWPKELFHAVFISLEKYNKPFKSAPLTLESKESPWDIPREEGRNFEVVSISNGAPIPDFVLRVRVNSNTIEREIHVPPPNFPIQSPADEMRIRELIKKFAVISGEDLASTITLDELIRTHVIEELNVAYADTEHRSIGNIQLLLTFQYYLDFIMREKDDGFFQIWDINLRETLTLIHPAVIDGLNKKLFDIEKAKKLKLGQIDLLSHFFYNKLIFNKELSYEISDDICRNLLSPATVNLLIQGKIKLPEALEMTSSTAAVIAHEFYFDLIQKNKLDFNKIKQLSYGQERLLLTPLYIQKISNGLVTIEELLYLPNNHLRMIGENPLISEILNEKLMTLSDLNRIPFKSLSRFWQKLNLSSVDDERDLLLQSLKKTKEKDKIKKLIKDFLTLSELNILSSDDFRYLLKYIENCLLSCFSKDRYELHRNHLILSLSIKDRCENNLQIRLQGILENRPQTLLNKAKDSIENIEAACKLTETNFRIIAERAMLYSITNSYKGFTRIPIDQLINYSRTWNLNLEKTWAQAFSIRLLRFMEGKPNTIENKLDTEEWITRDLKTVPTKENLSLELFHYNLVEQLHHNLKLLMTEIYNLDAEDTPQFYKQVYHKVSQIEDEIDSTLNKKAIVNKLIHSFNELAAFAKIELEKKATSVSTNADSLSLEEKKPETNSLSERRISNIGLFSHHSEHNDKKPSLHSFCRYLNSLPKILGVSEETPVLEYKLQV